MLTMCREGQGSSSVTFWLYHKKTFIKPVYKRKRSIENQDLLSLMAI